MTVNKAAGSTKSPVVVGGERVSSAGETLAGTPTPGATRTAAEKAENQQCLAANLSQFRIHAD